MNILPIRSIAVFGGSGKTGRQLIERAVTQGLRVRTLVRTTSRFTPFSGAVEVLAGSLQDSGDVERTLSGCDAVCCVFGPRPPFKDIFCARAMRIIIDAMRRCHVDRVVCQTSAMIGNYPQNRTWPFRFMVSGFNRFNRPMARDRADQEKIVRGSRLRWTIVKPPRLTDQPATRAYTAGPQVKVGLLSSISRADVSAFIVKEVIASEYIGEVVFIRTREEKERVLLPYPDLARKNCAAFRVFG